MFLQSFKNQYLQAYPFKPYSAYFLSSCAKAFRLVLPFALLKITAGYFSLPQMVFYFLATETIVEILKQKKTFRLKFSLKSLTLNSFLTPILLLIFAYTWISTLKQLPLSTSLCFYIQAIFFTPLILKYWIRQRLFKTYYLFFMFSSIALIFSFFHSSCEIALSLTLALFVAPLRSLHTLIKKRFFQKREPYLLLSALCLSLLGFFYTSHSFSFVGVIYLLFYSLFKILPFFNPFETFFKKIAWNEHLTLIPLTFLLSVAFDFWVFNHPPSLFLQISTYLFNCVLFTLFMKKKVLPNHLHPL